MSSLNWPRLLAWLASIAFCVWFWLTLAGLLMGMFGLRRGDLPEPPPADAPKGMAPGYHLTNLPSQAAVDAYCRAWGVKANDEYHKTFVRACVVRPLKAVIMPPADTWDAEKTEAVKAHEFAHTWGLVHKKGGHGWVLPAGLPGQTATSVLIPPKR